MNGLKTYQPQLSTPLTSLFKASADGEGLSEGEKAKPKGGMGPMDPTGADVRKADGPAEAASTSAAAAIQA